MSEIRRRVRVVGALCVEGGRVLLTQRPPGGANGGLWEFPGGKVEAGESEPQALRRELKEELGLAVDVGRQTHAVDHDAGALIIELRIYRCIPRGPLELIEATAAQWLEPAQLGDWPTTPADAPVVADLMARGIPPECDP